MNIRKSWEICMNIYRELYRNTIPKADFDKMIKSGEAKKKGFFFKYHISQSKEEEIIERHLKESKLKSFEKRRVREEIYLGASPCSCEGKNPEHEFKGNVKTLWEKQAE